MLYFLANMLSKTRPSRVQALSKRVQTPHFYVQAWEIRFQKYCKKQHGLVQAFRPTGLFIILKGRTTPMPVLRGLRLLDDAQISPFLEFYLRLLRFWFLTHSKSRQQPSPHCFREGRVLPGFGNRTPASTLNFLFWPMTLSIRCAAHRFAIFRCPQSLCHVRIQTMLPPAFSQPELTQCPGFRLFASTELALRRTEPELLKFLRSGHGRWTNQRNT